jgi:hypothetical protein
MPRYRGSHIEKALESLPTWVYALLITLLILSCILEAL